jgi:hypothetical protein
VKIAGPREDLAAAADVAAGAVDVAAVDLAVGAAGATKAGFSITASL